MPRSNAKRNRLSFGQWVKAYGWRHLVGVMMVSFAVGPLLYMVSAAFSASGTLTGSNRLFADVTLDNYVELFTTETVLYWRWFLNTMVVGVVGTAGTILIGALAAYAFSRRRFRGRRVGLTSILVVQMFPQFLAVTAIFVLMSWLGDLIPALGSNTLSGLTLLYLGGALGTTTYLMYGNMNTIPSAIDESATIDGAGHARIFFKMTLPLIKPMLVVVGFLTFITLTGDFVIASILLTDPESQTMAVGLTAFISDISGRNARWGAFTAGAVLFSLPTLIMFVFLQRYIVAGLTAGSGK